MAKKRKKTVQKRGAFSPYQYIREKARSFPIEKCLYTGNWEDSGLCQVLVVRKQPSGLFMFSLFLLDMWCLGVKNTLSNINYSEEDLEDFIENVNSSVEHPLEPCEYVYAHNLVYGALEYGEDLGFKPPLDFSVDKYLLEEDSDDIELIEFDFGREGRPYYVSGPHDDVDRVHRILQKSVGSGNYDF